MKQVSDRQKGLLDYLTKRRLPTSRFIERFLDFIAEEKKEDEPLDPLWLELWDPHRPSAETVASPTVLREIEEAMQSIQRIDPQVWDIRPGDSARVTFLLGAGASAPSGIPTVDKLLSQLWDRARKIGREDLDKLARWCKDRRITNIEDLLTAAYISDFTAKNQNITSLLDYFLFSRGQDAFETEEYGARRPQRSRTSQIDVSTIGFLQDTLQTLFGLLTNTMISASPNAIHEAIVDFIKKHKGSSIITTNYDGCMDEAILKNDLSLKATIAGENIASHAGAVDLVKMHGSINWAYCDSCQDVREFGLLDLKATYEEDRLSYPVIGICKNCGGLRRPLLVPPLSIKFLMFPNLIDIWNSARQSIENAGYLVVVGYSFSEADTYITKIISRSMSMNSKQKMLIVNTNPKLSPALRERFSSQIDAFDKKRILNACGAGEEILPKILRSMLGPSASKAKAPKKKQRKTKKPTE